MNLIDNWQELTRGLEQHCFIIIITLKESNKWQNQKETKDRIFNTLISFRNSLTCFWTFCWTSDVHAKFCQFYKVIYLKKKLERTPNKSLKRRRIKNHLITSMSLFVLIFL